MPTQLFVGPYAPSGKNTIVLTRGHGTCIDRRYDASAQRP
jgi:hypothetical protein